jgi:hypothetical protein
MRRIVLVALLSAAGSTGSALARGPHLATPQLGAGDCTAERSHCQPRRAATLESERLSCATCSNGSSLKPTLSGPSGQPDEAACPDAQASRGPTIPGCGAPLLDLESLPPL